MNTDLLFLNLNANMPVKARGFRHKFVIQQFECGLLYQNGKFVSRLNAGRHVRWGFGYALAKVDLRKQILSVSGQEVLTADNVGIKLSISVMLEVADPAKAMHEVQDWRAHVHNATQLALRGLVAAQPVEALLLKRLDLGKALLAALKTESEKVGVLVHVAEVKDVMFPGDLKKVFAEVLKARQEGQAALERARGESAALRNLANAARLLENNPALQNLRLMQSMSTAGHTLVLGVPAGFVPLKAGKKTDESAGSKAEEQ